MGRRTDVSLIAATAVFCVFVLMLEAHLAVDEGVAFQAVVAGFLLLLTLVVRTVGGLVRRGSRTPHWRLWTPWSLTGITVAVLFLFPPSELRWELSKSSLEDYARTAKPTNMCSEGPFRERWVGLYRISCADNHQGAVNLRVREPLIPSSGSPWLVWSGGWERWLQD